MLRGASAPCMFAGCDVCAMPFDAVMRNAQAAFHTPPQSALRAVTSATFPPLFSSRLLSRGL